jgi:hypothetical protein
MLVLEREEFIYSLDPDKLGSPIPEILLIDLTGRAFLTKLIIESIDSITFLAFSVFISSKIGIRALDPALLLFLDYSLSKIDPPIR